MDTLADKLKYLDPISLDELKAYKLMNRLDTKYVCHQDMLHTILERSYKDFRIQEINKVRNLSYETLYFDTPGLKTYFDHHQGKRLRYKVRFRKYLHTGDVFLEVKKKKNFTRTNKSRTKLPFSSSLEQPHYAFLSNHIELPSSSFKPNIWTLFDRITLAGKKHLERITIDTNIRFRNQEKEVFLPGFTIIEVKQEKAGLISPFTRMLRDIGIKPSGCSKYIMGNVMLNPGLKQNRFKRRLITINKICYGT